MKGEHFCDDVIICGFVVVKSTLALYEGVEPAGGVHFEAQSEEQRGEEDPQVAS